jgi:gliding motility-associated-like protein
MVAGNSSYQYQWQPAISNDFYAERLSAGQYSVYVSDANGCKDTLTLTLVNADMRSVSLGSDTAICGPSLQLTPGANYSKYKWQDGSTAPIFLAQRTGWYSVEVTDADTCIARDTVHVLFDCSDLNFPTAFTPNGDGRNDEFGAIGNLALVKSYSLRIFNRWGQLVFHTDNPFKKWPPANNHNTSTFVWMVEYTMRNKPGLLRQKGTVTLLR